MPKPDLEIILGVLNTIKHADGQSAAQRLKPRLGTLKPIPKGSCGEEPCTSAEGAWTAFVEFKGPGWLQDARTPRILHGEGQAWTPQLKAKPWPVAGERVSADTKRSLHLRRSAAGWVITTLEQAPSAEHLLLTQRILSTDLQHYLVYDVAYRPEDLNGHLEFRPFASRFLGYEPVKSGISPAARIVKPPAP